MAKEKICLIAGVGPGTGKASAKLFSENGYKVAMLARNINFLSFHTVCHLCAYAYLQYVFWRGSISCSYDQNSLLWNFRPEIFKKNPKFLKIN